MADVSAETTINGGRPFVLYLRSFSLDELDVPQVSFHPIWFLVGWSLRALRKPGFSQYVDQAVRDVFGRDSCVAVGLSDGDALNGAEGVFGPGRSTDYDWKSVVEKASANAIAIVVVVGRSTGVVTEIEHILLRGHVTKTVFLVPGVEKYIEPDTRIPLNVDDAREAQRDYAALQSLFERYGLIFPPIHRETLVAWVEPDGSLGHAQSDLIAPWRWPPKGSKTLAKLLKRVKM